MAESNIAKEHAGKHGVLTLGAARNPVTIKDVRTWDFDALIDGSEFMNTFFQSDGWQFTPDPDPLPTEPGWYVHGSETGLSTPTLFLLSVAYGWSRHSGGSNYASTSNFERMAQVHAADPLVRVSFGVAS